MTALAFTDGFDESRSLPAMNRRCTNIYPKYFQDEEGNLVKTLLGTPGQNQLATTGSASTEINRGSEVLADIPYFVNGTSLHKLNSDFTTTSLGTVDGSGKVSIAENGIQLMVLSPGGKGYIYNKNTAVFAEITDSDFVVNGRPQVVIFIDGFFLASTDSKKFIVSDLNDGLAWAPLDFGTAESDPDIIVSVVNFKNQAHILGSRTIEAQDNIGGADFPFIRNGLFLDKGCRAKFSVVKTSGTFLFIGGDKNEEPAVWSLQGNGLVSVSNTGVELLLGDLSKTQLDAVSGYTYSQDKSTFVAFELPEVTIVYELETGKWHKRQSQVVDVAGVTQTVGWRSTAFLRAYDKLICFDRQDGRVGDVDPAFFDEYGSDILRVFDTTSFRDPEGRTFAIPKVEAIIEAGVGNAAVTSPKIRMRKSKNARTFEVERIRLMGLAGDFEHRPVWRRNGRFKRSAQFRFLMSDQVKTAVMGVEADIRVGR